MSTNIDIDKLRLDGGTQPRENISQEIVDEYAEAMREGAQFPPMEVFTDGIDAWLADGFHRYYAALQVGLKEFPVNVHPGGQRAAVLYSVGANATHGVRRSNADKRRAVLVMLQDEEWRQWSNHVIAAKCAVNEITVRRLREDTGATLSQVKGADGKTYSVPLKTEPPTATTLGGLSTCESCGAQVKTRGLSMISQKWLCVTCIEKELQAQPSDAPASESQPVPKCEPDAWYAVDHVAHRLYKMPFDKQSMAHDDPRAKGCAIQIGHQINRSKTSGTYELCELPPLVDRDNRFSWAFWYPVNGNQRIIYDDGRDSTGDFQQGEYPGCSLVAGTDIYEWWQSLKVRYCEFKIVSPDEQLAPEPKPSPFGRHYPSPSYCGQCDQVIDGWFEVVIEIGELKAVRWQCPKCGMKVPDEIMVKDNPHKQARGAIAPDLWYCFNSTTSTIYNRGFDDEALCLKYAQALIVSAVSGALLQSAEHFDSFKLVAFPATPATRNLDAALSKDSTAQTSDQSDPTGQPDRPEIDERDLSSDELLHDAHQHLAALENAFYFFNEHPETALAALKQLPDMEWRDEIEELIVHVSGFLEENSERLISERQ